MVTPTSAIGFILAAVWFILPAYAANMAPAIFYKFFGKYNFPIDFGRNLFDGKRIFGDGKTWNGLAVGMMAGSLVGYAQGSAFAGFVLGSGALFGDLVKSFFKRRLGLPSGVSWPVFDQLDFVAGFLFFTYFIAQPPIEIIITIFFLTLALHPLTNLISYFIGFKKVWW